jgi:23S rRNA pseudouridine2605 synthase
MAPVDAVVGERLQKLLAQHGIASRRTIEQWIQDGRLTINGKPAQLGDKATPEDRIFLDGRLVQLRKSHNKVQHQHIIYNKPEGEVCSTRAEGELVSVFDQLPRLRGRRWISVGRLDANTGGLLIFTTDGTLANKLMHPSTGIERIYAVRVMGHPSEADLENLRKGVVLEDGPAHLQEVSPMGVAGNNPWFRISLAEGRNREVRRIWASLGFSVSRLKRIRFGPVELDRRLRRGHYRPLTDKEVSALYAAACLAVPGASEHQRPRRRRPGKQFKR